LIAMPLPGRLRADCSFWSTTDYLLCWCRGVNSGPFLLAR
jgi:hypothetical protein